MKTQQLMGMGAAIALMAGSAIAADGIRVVNWNISNYGGGRVSDLQTAFYAEFEGRSMDPDLIVAQEVLSQFAANTLLTILNTAPGSPGDWATGDFFNGPDTDNAVFYRTSKLEYLGMTRLPADGTSGAPRDVNRYDFELVGYDALETQIAIYSSHMKAGSGSSDQARRLIEARKIRDDAETLDPAINIILGGDFNIQRSTQQAYIELTGAQANNNGRFLDPIGTPGSWNNNSAFRFVHTQDPSGAGGMDDRHDQVLLDPSLGDGEGLDYRGSFGVPYSTTTWNDPNHSYRSWGNDGSTFNTELATTTNQMVGPAIAQALKTVAAGGGHLPVFLDLVVPAVIDAPMMVDLGVLPFGSEMPIEIQVGSAGDVIRWGASDAIQPTVYFFAPGLGLSAPAGTFSDDAGGSLNTHAVTIDAPTNPNGGEVLLELTVESNDPDQPLVVIPLMGTIGGCSIADTVIPFGQLDFFDVQTFLSAFSLGDGSADLTDDGVFDFFDVQEFLLAFSAGCP